MNKKYTRIGSMILLSIIIAMFITSCVIVTSVQIGHHQTYDKKSAFDDTDFEQGYETQIGKGRR